MAYVDATTIKLFAEAEESSPDTVWEILAASASLIFDRACLVEENFFKLAGNSATDKTFFINETGYYFIPPFVDDATIEYDGEEIDAETYKIQDNFLIAPELKQDNPTNDFFIISAKWGFAAIPADVKQAVIEQALFMWRRKDMAFTELSGVSPTIAQAQLSPTCEFVAQKYKEKYFQVNV